MPERLAASHRVVDLPAASSPPRHIGRFQFLLRRALAELEAIRHIVLTRLLRQLELRKKRLRALPCRMEQRTRAILPEGLHQKAEIPHGVRPKKLALSAQDHAGRAQILHLKAAHRDLLHDRPPFAAERVGFGIVRPDKGLILHIQHFRHPPYRRASRSKKREISPMERCA